MKAKILAGLLVLASMDASAKYNIENLRAQRLMLDNAITTRNSLLDRIGFAGPSPDASTLYAINGDELTIENSLEALETYLDTLNSLNRVAPEKSMGEMRSALGNICTLQKVEMDSQAHQLEDKRIAANVATQVDNAAKACDLIRGIPNM